MASILGSSLIMKPRRGKVERMNVMSDVKGNRQEDGSQNAYPLRRQRRPK